MKVEQLYKGPLIYVQCTCELVLFRYMQLLTHMVLSTTLNSLILTHCTRTHTHTLAHSPCPHTHVTHHIVLDEESQCVPDPRRDEVGGVTQENSAVGHWSVLGLTHIWLPVFLRYRLPSTLKLRGMYVIFVVACKNNYVNDTPFYTGDVSSGQLNLLYCVLHNYRDCCNYRAEKIIITWLGTFLRA